MGGSGKRGVPMARGMRVNTIGKLRGLRLPLPPVAIVRPRRFIRQREDFAMLT
jgi:hypothetical protein